MANRTAVLTKEAPAPSPHLSQAIVCNGMVYCSGSFGIDPVTRKLVGDAYEQTVRSIPASLDGSVLTPITETISEKSQRNSKGSWYRHSEHCQSEHFRQQHGSLCQRQQSLPRGFLWHT